MCLSVVPLVVAFVNVFVFAVVVTFSFVFLLVFALPSVCSLVSAFAFTID